MRFVKSSFNVAKTPEGKVLGQVWVNVTNQIAVQPSGMFMECLDPNPVPFTEAASPTQRLVLGVSSQCIWQGNVDTKIFAFSPLDPVRGGTDTNHLQMVKLVTEQWDINPVRFFGFPNLRPGSFHLIGTNQFQAFSVDDDVITGRVLATDDNRATKLELEYVRLSNTNELTSLTLKYPEEGELPNYFERKQFHADGSQCGINMTNWIEDVTYGIDTNVTEGYPYNLFFTNLAVFEQILLESNGQRYFLTQNGTTRLVNEHYVGPTLGRYPARRAILQLLIVFLVGGFIFVLVASRRQGNSK